MREDVTPTPLAPRDTMIEYALILRRSLTDCVKTFDQCIVDL